LIEGGIDGRFGHGSENSHDTPPIGHAGREWCPRRNMRFRQEPARSVREAGE
jgi:hypothetical protein